jgi:hypothetical protein
LKKSLTSSPCPQSQWPSEGPAETKESAQDESGLQFLVNYPRLTRQVAVGANLELKALWGRDGLHEAVEGIEASDGAKTRSDSKLSRGQVWASGHGHGCTKEQRETAEMTMRRAGRLNTRYQILWMCLSKPVNPRPGDDDGDTQGTSEEVCPGSVGNRKAFSSGAAAAYKSAAYKRRLFESVEAGSVQRATKGSKHGTVRSTIMDSWIPIQDARTSSHFTNRKPLIGDSFCDYSGSNNVRGCTLPPPPRLPRCAAFPSPCAPSPLSRLLVPAAARPRASSRL